MAGNNADERNAAESSQLDDADTLRIHRVLQQGINDLQDANWPGLMGVALHPLCDNVLLPLVRLTDETLQRAAITQQQGDDDTESSSSFAAIPLACSAVDLLLASLIGTSFGIVKWTFSILPHSPTLEQHSLNQFIIQFQYIVEKTKRIIKDDDDDKHDFDLANVASLLLGATGFAVNTLVDFLQPPIAKRYLKWLQMIHILIAYLVKMGIDQELRRAFVTPRIMDNLILVGRIQQEYVITNHQDGNDSRIERCKFPDSNQIAAHSSTLVRDSKRFIKFSVAAYGVLEIESTKIVDTEASSNNTTTTTTRVRSALVPMTDSLSRLWSLVTNIFRRERIRRMAQYLKIPHQDIVILMPSNNNVNSDVHYFVALDHSTRSIVMGIRGTNSITETLTDAVANAVSFCGGFAHKGMVDQVVALVSLPQHRPTWNTIQTLLQRYEGYRLVFTGHSLGAGIASLLSLYFNYHYQATTTNNNNNNVDVASLERPIMPMACHESECFGYGCPPVFTCDSSTIKNDDDAKLTIPDDDNALSCSRRAKEAMSKTMCFINGSDVVPFLCVDSVRRLADTLSKVDDVTQDLDFISRLKMVRGLMDPTPELIDIVKKGSRDMDRVDGANRLAIPAKAVLWFHPDNANEPATLCQPDLLANLSIELKENAIAHHLTPRYVESLEEWHE